MDERRKVKSGSYRTFFDRQVGLRERRKLKAQRGKSRSIWFGLGMLGFVGWSVALLTLLGIALGRLDQQPFSQPILLDTHATYHRAAGGLSDRMALDGKGIPGNSERAGRGGHEPS